MKSILVGLTLILWILWYPCYTQTEADASFCLPLPKARLLIRDALAFRYSDSLIQTLGQRIELLEARQVSSDLSYTKLLNLSEQKYNKQKESTLCMEKLAMSYKSERDYYIKRERKQRRKKNLLTYGGLVLLGIIAIK